MAVERHTTAASSATNSFAHAIGAGNNRCLIVGVTQEVATPAQLAVAYGGQSMAHIAGILVGDSTDQRVDLYFLNDAGIVAASGNLIVLTSPPASFSIHAAAYQYVVQTTPTVTDTYALTGSGTVVLSLTSTDNGCVVCLGGMGNDGTTEWTGGVTEQTDQSIATTAVGSLADELIGTGAAETYTATWTPVPNRRAGVAANLAFDAGEGITSIDPDEFDMDNGDIDVNSTPGSFDASGNDVYLSPNDLLSEAGEVDISAAINTESTTVINLDLTQLSAGTLASLQSMGPGARFIIVDAAGGEYFIAVTLHRPEAFVMSLGAGTPGATTARLTAPDTKTTGDFDAGRFEEAANPATAVDITADDYTEMVWSMEAQTLAREVQYDFRVTKSGVVIDDYTETPQLTITGVIGRAIAGAFAGGGVLSRIVTFARDQAGDVDGAGALSRKGTLSREQAGNLSGSGSLARTSTFVRALTAALDMAGTVAAAVAQLYQRFITGRI